MHSANTRAVRSIDATIPAPAIPCVSPGGRNMRQLIQGGFNQLSPAFSPDGTQLAIIVANQVTSDATGEAFVVDLKNVEATQLRTSAGLSLAPDTTTRLNWLPQPADRAPGSNKADVLIKT